MEIKGQMIQQSIPCGGLIIISGKGRWKAVETLDFVFTKRLTCALHSILLKILIIK